MGTLATREKPPKPDLKKTNKVVDSISVKKQQKIVIQIFSHHNNQHKILANYKYKKI